MTCSNRDCSNKTWSNVDFSNRTFSNKACSNTACSNRPYFNKACSMVCVVVGSDATHTGKLHLEVAVVSVITL